MRLQYSFCQGFSSSLTRHTGGAPVRLYQHLSPLYCFSSWLFQNYGAPAFPLLNSKISCRPDSWQLPALPMTGVQGAGQWAAWPSLPCVSSLPTYPGDRGQLHLLNPQMSATLQGVFGDRVPSKSWAAFHTSPEIGWREVGSCCLHTLHLCRALDEVPRGHRLPS